MKKYRMNDNKKSEYSEEFLKNINSIRKGVSIDRIGHARYLIKIKSTGFIDVTLEYNFENTRDDDYEALKKICDYNVVNVLDVVPKDNKVCGIESEECKIIISKMKETINEMKQIIQLM